MPQYVPLSREHHATKSWRRFEDFAFARSRPVVPILHLEAIVAASAMPLAFLREQDAYVPCAVMSLPPGRNAFVAPQTGKWLGAYVPAMLRVYPFLFIKPPSGGEALLCVDQEVGLLESSEGGEALFEADGKPTAALQEAIKNSGMVEQHRLQTVLATAALAEAGVLVPWELTLTVDRTQRGVAGLHHVDFGKLESLGAEQLAKLHEVHALGLAYAQLVSEGRVADLQALTTRLESSLTVADAQRLKGVESLDTVFGISSDGNLRFGS